VAPRSEWRAETEYVSEVAQRCADADVADVVNVLSASLLANARSPRVIQVDAYYLKNNPAKFHSHPIWNDGSLKGPLSLDCDSSRLFRDTKLRQVMRMLCDMYLHCQ